MRVHTIPATYEAVQFHADKRPWPPRVEFGAVHGEGDVHHVMGKHGAVVVREGDWVLYEDDPNFASCGNIVAVVTDHAFHARFRPTPHQTVPELDDVLEPFETIRPVVQKAIEDLQIRVAYAPETNAATFLSTRIADALIDGGLVEDPEAAAADDHPPAPFHRLFTDPALAAINRTFTIGHDDLRPLLQHVETLADRRMPGRDAWFDAFMGDTTEYGASASSLLAWWSNGPAPAPRRGMLAMYHPQVHKRFWSRIYREARRMAQALERWVWIVEANETRWMMLLLGDAPDDEQGQTDTTGGDQYLACFAPDGTFHFVGCS